METLRKPFQGVINIIRFNWHFYLLSIGITTVLWVFSFLKTPIHPNFTLIPAFFILLITIVSLLVSTYVYDVSNLYSLKWLDDKSIDSSVIINVNAGFDETSSLLKKKYPQSNLSVLDFYDPKKHTEISIKRARKAYPLYPGTLQINTDKIPLKNKSATVGIAILSTHEIRNDKEREFFF
jgi:hypothetical protein